MFASEATALTCLILSEAELRYPDGMELRWSVTASAGQTLPTSVFHLKKLLLQHVYRSHICLNYHSKVVQNVRNINSEIYLNEIITWSKFTTADGQRWSLFGTSLNMRQTFIFHFHSTNY